MEQHPFIFSNKWKYRISRHLAFWLFWWVFQGFLYAFAQSPSAMGYFHRLPATLIDSLLYLPAHIFLAYTLMYFVIPAYIIKGKYFTASAWVIILFIATAFLSFLIRRYLLYPGRELFLPEYLQLPYPDPRTSLFLSLLAGLRGGITIGGMAAAIKLMKHWYVKEQRNLQLQKENTEAQLQLLKAQVHPHFLFNTLNNIYSFTQNTSLEASRLVTGLSDLLRFILYGCNQPLIPLSLELKMLKDYINLEQIRYGNKLELHLDFPENTDDLCIAPLLLLPFVENCFKHGTSHVLENPWINLQISIEKTQMKMKLLNGKVNKPTHENGRQGIGIQNAEKRMKLLYPGKHDLNITNEEEVFIVNLKIELEHKKMSEQKKPHIESYA
ncbi:MAG TPA: histidine kinase [Chitinophagaceae bacterium]|nr:histidine kinase [Chitinophagaceae bacterium]